jgi:hypothetical protein
MSRNINVSPGHHKVAGRERQGEEVNIWAERAKLAKNAERSRTPNDQPQGAKRKA